jgi:hypothetical protein
MHSRKICLMGITSMRAPSLHTIDRLVDHSNVACAYRGNQPTIARSTSVTTSGYVVPLVLSS